MIPNDHDDTLGFAAPATGYRSLTGRHAPVTLMRQKIPKYLGNIGTKEGGGNSPIFPCFLNIL